MDQKPKISPLARGLALLISVVVAAVGIWAIFTEYAPGGSTRFGVTPPIFGVQATQYGFILVLLSLLPLLLFFKTSNQVAIYGSALGALIVISIFYLVYF